MANLLTPDLVTTVLSTLSLSQLLALKASDEVQARFDELVRESASGQLTEAERDELNHYIILERCIRLAKLQAHSDGRISEAD